MKMTQPNETNVLRALLQLRALKELEATTFTKTTRAQNEILRSLTDADLIAVAVALKSDRTGENNEPASPRK
jgi:hypothetical protein